MRSVIIPAFGGYRQIGHDGTSCPKILWTETISFQSANASNQQQEIHLLLNCTTIQSILNNIHAIVTFLMWSRENTYMVHYTLRDADYCTQLIIPVRTSKHLFFLVFRKW